MTRVFLALVVAFVPAIAAAAPRSYAVDVTPAGDWRSEALALTLAADLADDRLVAATTSAADLDVHITLVDHLARYELDARWPGAPASRRGEIRLTAVDRAGLAAHLRDELHVLARVTRDDRIEVAIAAPSIGFALLATAIVAMVLGIPFAIGAVRKRRIVAAPALRRMIVGVAAAGVAAVVVTRLGGSMFAGGLAWGSFFVVTLPIVCPPIAGFGRIEHDELWRVIGAWMLAVVERSITVVALYAPVALVAWLAAGASAVVVVPIAMLVARSWVRCVVAVAAAVLDDRLVDTTTDVDAWHAATRAYVVGYLRRAGVPVDDDVLRRVRMLPGRGDRVVTYGGGLTHSRVIIPRAMLELALAPWGRPHDYAAPRVSTLHWTEWNAGLMMPTEPGDVLATAEQRKPHELTDAGEAERQMLGEPPTLAGTIEPSDLDARKTYRPHDDPMWLDWDPGDDYDGTDAGDRDFLFGAVVHALGAIERHEDRIATMVLFVPKLRARPSALGDYHAALRGARHHLVQYLGWNQWHREDLLTARAYLPELEATSRKVLATLDGDHRALRDRVARLADPGRPTRFGRLVLAGALVAIAGVVGTAVVGALRYHATFEETRHG